MTPQRFGEARVDGPEAMLELGAAIGARCLPRTQIGLQGELGAGKTTLVRGIASGIGVTSPIASPTFAIVEDHGELIHVDWYRIQDEFELDAIDFDGYLDRESVVVVEWADRFPTRLDEDAMVLHIEATDPNSRRVVAFGVPPIAVRFAEVFTQ